jgi:hypothetical protein
MRAWRDRNGQFLANGSIKGSPSFREWVHFSGVPNIDHLLTNRRG